MNLFAENHQDYGGRTGSVLQERFVEERYPRIVFFSGGTALNSLAARMAEVNPQCSYIITTFDSGGSSAKLRELFDMPAVGDVRNRLIALADTATPERERIVRLLSTRLARIGDYYSLMGQISHLANGSHELMDGIPDTVRNILADRFALFLDLAGERFDPANASLGNIILAAGFMAHQRVMAPPIAQFSRLIRAGGTVRASTVDNGHLAVRLKTGEIIAGQHLFTGKESPPVHEPIDGMWICSGINDPWPRAIHASSLAIQLVQQADLIVYPMGSFYSSLLAAVYPKGLGKAIFDNPCPKIFVPNMGHDPELLGHDIPMQVDRIMEVLQLDNGAVTKRESVLNGVLVDSDKGDYPGGMNVELLYESGIKVIDRKLVSDDSEGLIDPDLLAPELLKLADGSFLNTKKRKI